MAVTYANGMIPQTALAPIPAADGQTAYLLPGPAASFLRVAATCLRAHGWAPVATSAGDGFRSYDRQVSVFRQRYRATYSTVVQGGKPIVDRRVWDGVPYWRFTGPAAAVPGTSNHGKGITVDISGLGGYSGKKWLQIAPLLTAEGWSNAEGRSISEYWHWNYTRTAELVTNTNTLPGVDIPIVTIPDLPDPLEDELNAQEAALLQAAHDNAAEARRLAGAALDEVHGVATAVAKLQEGIDAIFLQARDANTNSAATRTDIPAATADEIARRVRD